MGLGVESRTEVEGVSQRQASACGDEFCVTGDFALSLLLSGDFNQLP